MVKAAHFPFILSVSHGKNKVNYARIIEALVIAILTAIATSYATSYMTIGILEARQTGIIKRLDRTEDKIDQLTRDLYQRR